MLRHALRDWAALEPFLGSGRLLVLLDYDGTLTPIAAHPALARLPAGGRRALKQLSRAPQTRVGVVSGRSLAAVRRVVGLPGLLYVGNHGFEIQGPGLRFSHPGARRARDIMARIAADARRALRGVRGSFVETKGPTLSVHWRLVPKREAARFHRLAGAALRPWVARGQVRLTRGKRVIEVRPPVAWDKGEAVRWLARRGPGPLRIVYLGDDRTDEDAFRAVNRLRGVAIFIGARPRSTAAGWWLDEPRQVYQFLGRLQQARAELKL